ncbi:MAG: pyridoxal phosphate-dependent aminotransferase [Candidatus Thermoplasmatota archaeon]|nr:pyridoxal phosphate-dependent aminotransferase [Candidatus Thermoplasmatota archaeon]
MFSKRIRNVQPSGTVMLSNKVKRLKSQGLDIISFTLGEPDFNTPDHIIDAAKKALDDGLTHYMQSLGMPELREAIADHVKKKNHIPAEGENVIILPTKFALYSAIQALVNSGEQVIFPNPGWVSYGPMVALSKGRPVPVKMRFDNGWYWDPDDIRSHVTHKTKAIILNNPSNPTGSIMSKETLKEIAEIAIEKDLVIISDEVYENLVYENKHFSIGSLDEVKEKVVTISGFSKSYAMTGWRIGWMVGSTEIIKMVNKLQQHSLTCLPGFVQMGALAALRNGMGSVVEMREEFKARRDLVIPLLNEIPGVSCEVPKGAFYAFFKMDLGFRSMDLAEMLLYKAHVALTPGSAFGSAGEGYLRMSYATSRENLTEGVKRIDEFARSLKKSS